MRKCTVDTSRSLIFIKGMQQQGHLYTQVFCGLCILESWPFLLVVWWPLRRGSFPLHQNHYARHILLMLMLHVTYSSCLFLPYWKKCHSLLSVIVLLAPTRALSVPPRWSFSLELLFWQKPLKMGKLVLLPSNALWTWFASLGEKKFHYLFRPLPLAHFQPKFSKRMF